MKKFFLILPVIFLLLTCKQLDRINPTDPKSSNYIGVTYKGSFGDFNNLSDFVIKDNYIYCIDSVKEDCNKYDLSGKLEFGWSGAFTYPTGICADENYIYILNKTPTNRVLVFDATNETTILTPVNQFLINQGYKIAVSGSYFYVACSSTPDIYKYDKITGTVALDFPVVEGDCNSCLAKISAIEIHSGGNILVADSVLRKIVAFDPSGNFIKTININIDIEGFAVKENTLLIPSYDGVYEISYENGSVIKKWGDYGEGNGKITEPSIIDFFGDKIYIGNKTSIKYFAP